MFRDLKEYKNLQKLYEEKVSKVENINEENVRGANMKGSVNVGNMFKKIGDALKPKPIVRPEGTTSVRQSGVNTNKKIEVKKEPEYKPVPGVVFGQRANEVGALGDGKPSSVFHDTSKGPKVIEPENQSREFGPGGQPSASEQIKKARLAGKTGSEKAQELAKMRKESGKTIADVKKANTDAMRARAAKRFADFKAKREAKRLKRMKKEEFTPYDMVLEYLLSTEQAATIEEANYVMTEMDTKTIQEIIKDVTIDEKFNINKVRVIPALFKLGAAGVGTKMIASKLGQSSVKPVTPPTVTPPVMPSTTKKEDEIVPGSGIEARKPGESLSDYKKRRTNNLNTQIEKL